MMGATPPARSIAWLGAAGDVGPAVPAGGYMGEGLMPIPGKLVKKISSLEMRDLLPEVWLREEDDFNDGNSKNVLVLPKKKAAPVTDITTWVQCFAGLVSVMASQYPRCVPVLMVYMATIVKCAKEFEGNAWANYDRAFRKQMCQLKDVRWSRVNSTLYSLCFADKARRNRACSVCLATIHSTNDCPEVQGGLWPWQHSEGGSTSQQERRKGSRRVCWLFNSWEGSRCNYNPCKFEHICAVCNGDHMRSRCPSANRSSKAHDSLGSKAVKRPRPF